MYCPARGGVATMARKGHCFSPPTANQLKLLLTLKEQLQTIIEQGMIFDGQDTELAALIVATRHGVLTSHVQTVQRLGSFVQKP